MMMLMFGCSAPMAAVRHRSSYAGNRSHNAWPRRHR